jgi:hypothetical protein
MSEENDIKIICNEQKLYKTLEIFQNYSTILIKSGRNFNKNEIFKINNIIIEGLNIEISKFKHKGNTKIQISFIENCKKNGKFVLFNIFKKNNILNEQEFLDSKYLIFNN